MAVVVGVADRTKTGIEPRRTWNARCRTGVHLVDQVAREGVDIHSIRDIPYGVAVAHNVVGVRAVVTDTGGKIIRNLAFQSKGPNIRFWRLQQRIDSADTEA